MKSIFSFKASEIKIFDFQAQFKVKGFVIAFKLKIFNNFLKFIKYLHKWSIIITKAENFLKRLPVCKCKMNLTVDSKIRVIIKN